MRGKYAMRKKIETGNNDNSQICPLISIPPVEVGR